ISDRGWIEWLKKHNDFNELGIESKNRGLLLTTKNYQTLKKEHTNEQ
ncbi:unnamed protein product, partial [marine sediment metagenome]